jgi:hypothetical protein
MVSQIQASTVGGRQHVKGRGISVAARFSFREHLLMLSAILQIRRALQALKTMTLVSHKSTLLGCDTIYSLAEVNSCFRLYTALIFMTGEWVCQASSKLYAACLLSICLR